MIITHKEVARVLGIGAEAAKDRFKRFKKKFKIARGQYVELAFYCEKMGLNYPNALKLLQ